MACLPIGRNRNRMACLGSHQYYTARQIEGGCEGLAMLNRTNRTLSANLNGLNLGTRSLAATAINNTGDLQALRIRHDDHRHVMRDGMPSYSRTSSSIRSGVGIPVIPGSPSVSSWLSASLSVRPWVGSELAGLLFTASGSLCRLGERQGCLAERLLEQKGRSKPGPKPGLKRDRQDQLAMQPGQSLAMSRATQPAAAAIVAATGG